MSLDIGTTNVLGISEVVHCELPEHAMYLQSLLSPWCVSVALFESRHTMSQEQSKTEWLSEKYLSPPCQILPIHDWYAPY
jgi:hypothetical protein